jgi:glycosyltransferase involved in cell wall biosynthesis
MKNVIVLADFPPLIGGPTIWYYRICEILVARGYTLYSLGGRGEPPAKVTNLNPPRRGMLFIRTIRFIIDLCCEAWTQRSTLARLLGRGVLKLSDIGSICSYLVLIRRSIGGIPREQGVVLAAHANRNSLLGYLLCRRHGNLSLVIRCHGACVIEFATLRPELVRFLLSSAAGVNCVSRYIADIAVQRGASPERTRIILSARDVPDCPVYENKKNKVVFCANLKPHKDPITYVKAVETFLSEYPDLRGVQFYLIGDGPLRQEIDQYAFDHGLGNALTMTGSMPFERVWGLMRESKIVVLTSRREPSGAVLTEAMANGCYCIATSVGGVPEIVTAERGSLFEPGNYKALAALIAGFFRDEDAHRRRAQAAYQYVKDQYTFERAADELQRGFVDISRKV